MSDHADDTELHLGFGEDGGNGFGETLETIDAGDEDILNPPVPQFGDDLKPEFRPLGPGQPEAQSLLLALHGDADGEVDGFGGLCPRSRILARRATK